MTIETKKWNSVKGKIIARFGTIKACGAQVPCSDEAIRQAIIHGKCPRVRTWLKKKGLLAA